MTRNIIQFTKMHGIGNDFVVINSLNQTIDMKKLSIPRLANRHVGIGFDQLLLIERSHHSADFFCRIYNSDGSEAEQCGNGLRCVARYIHEEGIHANKLFSIETKAGIFPLEIHDYDRIRVSMGAPEIINNLVELTLPDQPSILPMSILSIGNPHAITKVESLEATPVNILAPKISMHSLFPNGVNIGFMQIINQNHIRLRTFERGAGETFACGSNACAAAVAGITNGWLNEHVKVDFVYGSLEILWEGKDKPIHMTGPASKVYSGKFEVI